MDGLASAVCGDSPLAEAPLPSDDAHAPGSEAQAPDPLAPFRGTEAEAPAPGGEAAAPPAALTGAHEGQRARDRAALVFEKFASPSGAIDVKDLGAAIVDIFHVHMTSSQRSALMARITTREEATLQHDEFLDFATEFAKSLPARFPYESLSDLKVVSFGTSVPLGIGFSVDNDFPGLPAVDAVEGAAEEVRARARGAPLSLEPRPPTNPEHQLTRSCVALAHPPARRRTLARVGGSSDRSADQVRARRRARPWTQHARSARPSTSVAQSRSVHDWVQVTLCGFCQAYRT